MVTRWCTSWRWSWALAWVLIALIRASRSRVVLGRCDGEIWAKYRQFLLVGHRGIERADHQDVYYIHVHTRLVALRAIDATTRRRTLVHRVVSGCNVPGKDLPYRKPEIPIYRRRPRQRGSRRFRVHKPGQFHRDTPSSPVMLRRSENSPPIPAAAQPSEPRPIYPKGMT